MKKDKKIVPQNSFTELLLYTTPNGKTAAEIISERANSNKPNMGLTTWKNAPAGKIRETDVTIAKNYLHEKEL